MSEKVKALLVDYGSESLDLYSDLFSICAIKTIPYTELPKWQKNNFDLVLLSDGHSINVNENSFGIQFIKESSIPIIGLCYGFQLICCAYGESLERLPVKSEGIHLVVARTKHSMFGGVCEFNAFEKHSFSVKNTQTNPSLIYHAESKDGLEIVEVIGKKQYGFQFHPEVVSDANQGAKIVENLLNYLY